MIDRKLTTVFLASVLLIMGNLVEAGELPPTIRSGKFFI